MHMYAIAFIFLLVVSMLLGTDALKVMSLIGLGLSILYMVCFSKKDKYNNVNRANRYKLQHAQVKKPEPFFKVEVKAFEPYYNTSIAGVQYRCDHQDVGGFLGYIQHDPTNPHDPNAIAIYRNDGKHLGYIPKDETNSLRRWSAKEELPCVGFIKEGDEVPLFGKVKVLDTFSEEVELEVTKYVRWMVSQFGVKFIPSGFAIDPAPTTKKQALEILDEYIENKEAEIYEEDSDEAT